MSIEAYLDARTRFESIDKAIEALATKMISVGRALSEARDKFYVSDVDIPAPNSVTGNRPPVLRATDWPSANRLQELILAWHSAHQEMHSSWVSISASRQTALRPPIQWKAVGLSR